MVRASAGVVLFALLSGVVFGQSANIGPAPSTPADTPPAFELADVHVSPHSNSPSYRGGALRGDRYIVREATMTDLIAAAYGLESKYVLGGPSWLDLDRFEVSAKAPRTTPPDTVKLMLRTLLADRFKLVAHTDTKPLPAFALTVAKGTPKMKEADGSGEHGCQYQPPPKDVTPVANPPIAFSCHNTTMEAFAQFLHQVASPYLTKPVFEATGLKGAWDFEIRWNYQVPKPDAEGITIFDAVEKQLGLKLETKTEPLPVVVVDSVNQKPAPNPPGVDKALPPPPPAEFEVAVIRPSNPNAKNLNIMIDGAGKINVQGASLQALILFAWDLDSAMLADAPKWLNDDHWDIVGKAATDTAADTPGRPPLLDFDDFKHMLQNLLIDRFKLTIHSEDRPYDAYTLMAANPKMKKADPANRTGCKTGPGADGKDPRTTNPNLGRLVTCLNMTMPQFADQLQSMAAGYIKCPVLDATGIEGAYDFTLSFSTTGQLRASQRAATGGDPPAGAASAASDPSGAISLPDALPKEVGLKLEKVKRPVAMLVIDHVEPKPTEN